MSAINEILVSIFGELGPLIVVGALGFVLICIAGWIYMSNLNDPFTKLNKAEKETKTETVVDGKRKSLRESNKGSDQLDKFAGFLEPQDAEEYSAIKLKLLQAGYTSKSAVQTYHFLQFALGIAGLILGALYTMANGDFAPKTLMMYIAIPGGVGYMAPKYWVTRRQATRKQEIEAGFPDALDLLLVCVEAGQSMDQSIIKVSQEIRSGFADLADELEIVAYEIKAGKDKTTVFKDLGERCGVQDIQSFVTVLIQSTNFGTSIAEALRVYSEEMRDKRVMRAEEKANVLPTKLTLGTMMFCVPALLIIMVGPSVYSIVQNFN